MKILTVWLFLIYSTNVYAFFGYSKSNFLYFQKITEYLLTIAFQNKFNANRLLFDKMSYFLCFLYIFA